jgi:hypothetical protein
MGMEMNLIDTVPAHTLEPGDVTEFWVEDDSEEGRYTLETVVKVEDDEDFVLIYTEENDEPWSVEPFTSMRLFAYTDD